MQSSPNSTSPFIFFLYFWNHRGLLLMRCCCRYWFRWGKHGLDHVGSFQANKTLSDYINGEGGSTCSCWCKNRCVNTWLGCVHGSGMTIFDRSLDYELNTGGVYICFFISSFTDYKNTLFFVSIRNNLLWIDYWNGQFMLMFGFGCRMTISLTYELVCL